MKTFVCLVTGPPGSGKTTITNLLAQEFNRSAVIDVDTLKKMIRAGM